MRLIDADALFEVIKKSMAENPHKEETQRAMHIHEHKYFLTLLTSFPTIQPEERTEKRMETHGVCLDAISRQAAIDAVEKMNIPEDMCVFEILSHIEVEIATPPTIQPEPTDEQVAEYCKRRCLHVVTDDFFRAAQLEPKWIPCSEGTPKKTGYYICTCHDGVCYRTSVLKWSTGWVLTGARSYWKVIAWMPLPEPYRKGADT